jgi:hypothetical protein
MAGIEFRVGRTDHHKVEDFLSTGAHGVAGVRIDATNLRIHSEVIEAALRADVDLFVEPLTERMSQPGFNPAGLDYGFGPVIRPQQLHRSQDQLRLVEAVVARQVTAGATGLTPPHFFVERHDALDLNVALTRSTIALYGEDHAVHPILAVASTYLRRHADDIARRYADAGLTAIQLRVSPLGGEDVGPQAIRRLFTALTALQRAGLIASLGLSGTIGHVTTALGLTNGFSTGIGYRERYDHRAAMASQRRPTDDEARFGALARVYLPQADLLVPRAAARELYADHAIRAELGCRLGDCVNVLDGPLRDPRGHYLHARTHGVQTTMRRPDAWRPMGVREQLVAARAMRDRLRPHLPSGFTPAGRTISSLIAEIDRWTERARSA